MRRLQGCDRRDRVTAVLTREQILAAAIAVHDEQGCGCERKYLMICQNLVAAILGLNRKDTTMETALYRNRANPSRIVEAVQLTNANMRQVFEWAPGKQHVGPGPDYRWDGLNIFVGDGSRRHATYGDWVYRDQGTERYWMAKPGPFAYEYKLVEEGSQ